jgi:hypothetical protein
VFVCVCACVYFASVTACGVVLWLVAWLAPPYFLHDQLNGKIFRKTFVEYKTCVLVFCETFVWKVSHFKKISTRCYNKSTSVCLLPQLYIGLYVTTNPAVCMLPQEHSSLYVTTTVRLYVCDYSQNLVKLKFSQQSFEKYFMKIRPFVSCQRRDRRTNGRTDAKNCIVAFCSFVNVLNP